MVKRVLSICLIIIAGATSLVASVLHQKAENPSAMYEGRRQYETEIYYNTMELELDDLVLHSNDLHMEDKIAKTNIVSDVAVAGIFVAKIKASTTGIEQYEYEVTKEERKMLEKISEAECTGQDIDSKKNIISNILNRVESDSFPSTIEKVIYQKGQYSPTSDGRIDSVEVTEETKQAVEEVLLDGTTHDCLYFFNMKDVQSSKIKKWIDNKLEFVFKDKSGHSHYIEK